MFPTISHLIKYLTGFNIPLPIQTFGFVMALAFWTAYIAFKKELRRKEKLGYIQPFTRQVTVGKPASLLLMIVWALTGFILGYKFFYCVFNYQQFVARPSNFLFSTNGNLVAGLITALVAAGWFWFYKKQLQLEEPVVEQRQIHPYEWMDRLLLWCAVYGFIGSLVFAKAEYIGELFTDPVKFLTTYNGITFYGGFIFGAGIYLIITKRWGFSLATAADIGSPGMMLAYGVGRMGCHLSGDGDWGVVNTAAKPTALNWLPDSFWAFDFPHNVARQGRFIENCSDSYCNVLLQPVFPTSLYESLICLAIFAGLWLSRNKIKTPGMMFFIFILCNGLERFFMEYIKVNIEHCVFGICFTQAQYIALVFCLMGISGLIWLKSRQQKTVL